MMIIVTIFSYLNSDTQHSALICYNQTTLGSLVEEDMAVGINR